MKRVCALIILVTAMRAAEDPYAPLRLYDGAWDVRMSGKPVEHLVNRCAQLSAYYACQQTVGGKNVALIVFLPRDQPGQYWTNSLSTEAKANGRGELSIDGDRWVYSSQEGSQQGKTKFYRTLNVFSGRDRIHFELSESTDGKTWAVTNSGEESRAVPFVAPAASPAK